MAVPGRKQLVRLLWIVTAACAAASAGGKAAGGKAEEQRKGEPPPQDARTDRPIRLRAFYPVAPPPLAGGPKIPAGQTPTPYAAAKIGMKAAWRIHPPRGEPSRQSLEIIRTDRRFAYARQTAESSYGRFVQELAFPRYVESPPATDQFNPPQREKYLGDCLVAVGRGTRTTTAIIKLLCHLWEAREGFVLYHTLRCEEEVPGGMVEHADNAAGRWEIRLRLTDLQN